MRVGGQIGQTPEIFQLLECAGERGQCARIAFPFGDAERGRILIHRIEIFFRLFDLTFKHLHQTGRQLHMRVNFVSTRFIQAAAFFVAQPPSLFGVAGNSVPRDSKFSGYLFKRLSAADITLAYFFPLP